MPSLMRFLTVLGAVAAIGFGAVYALGTFVSPRTREMTVTIPPARLRPPAAEARDDAGLAVGSRAERLDGAATR